MGCNEEGETMEGERKEEEEEERKEGGKQAQTPPGNMLAE